MSAPHFDKVDRAADGGSRECALPRPRYRPFRKIVGRADNRELRRECVDETRQPKGRDLEAVALYVVALYPLHPAQIHAHGESGGKDLAQADADVPTVIGISLPRTGGIIRPEESRFFVFVFLLVGIPPVEPGIVAEVVINTAAVLVRIV